MNGSEKQIAYAETLMADRINYLNSIVARKTNTIDTMRIPRPEMIQRLNSEISTINTLITAINHFTGYAGNMIDFCKTGESIIDGFISGGTKYAVVMNIIKNR